MATSKELAPIRVDSDGIQVFQVGTLEVRGFARMPRLVQVFVADVADAVGTDADEATNAIMAEILAAETVEETMARGIVVHGGDLIGRTFTIHGVKWNRSAFTKGLPFYAVLDCSEIGGETHFIATTSAANIMAQVWKWNREGWFPADVRLDEARTPTPDGFKPQRLVPPDSPEEF